MVGAARTILIAPVGLNPQVITETLYALLVRRRPGATEPPPASPGKGLGAARGDERQAATRGAAGRRLGRRADHPAWGGRAAFHRGPFSGWGGWCSPSWRSCAGSSSLPSVAQSWQAASARRFQAWPPCSDSGPSVVRDLRPPGSLLGVDVANFLDLEAGLGDARPSRGGVDFTGMVSGRLGRALWGEQPGRVGYLCRGGGRGGIAGHRRRPPG